jgi:hypothetical protein
MNPFTSSANPNAPLVPCTPRGLCTKPTSNVSPPRFSTSAHAVNVTTRCPSGSASSSNRAPQPGADAIETTRRSGRAPPRQLDNTLRQRTGAACTARGESRHQESQPRRTDSRCSEPPMCGARNAPRTCPRRACTPLGTGIDLDKSVLGGSRRESRRPSALPLSRRCLASSAFPSSSSCWSLCSSYSGRSAFPRSAARSAKGCVSSRARSKATGKRRFRTGRRFLRRRANTTPSSRRQSVSGSRPPGPATRRSPRTSTALIGRLIAALRLRPVAEEEAW